MITGRSNIFVEQCSKRLGRKRCLLSTWRQWFSWAMRPLFIWILCHSCFKKLFEVTWNARWMVDQIFLSIYEHYWFLVLLVLNWLGKRYSLCVIFGHKRVIFSTFECLSKFTTLCFFNWLYNGLIEGKKHLMDVLKVQKGIRLFEFKTRTYLR